VARYLNRSWTRRELAVRFGDTAQVAGLRPSVITQGNGAGVGVVDVWTGSGLAFTVVPDRGMDVAQATWKGRSLCWLSPTGVVSPAHSEAPGPGWLRSFGGGLLATCGLGNVGPAVDDEGKPYGVHGRIGTASAENLALTQEWQGDELELSVRGTLREAAVFGENLRLTRTLSTRLGASGFSLDDRVENLGFAPEPLHLLYHFNFGSPLLGPGARVVAPLLSTMPRDEAARADRGVETCRVFPPPTPGFAEKVFIHTLARDAQGRTFVALLNDDVGDGTPLGVVLRWKADQLPCFTQWTMAGEGTYVLGLEPGTVVPLGRRVLREAGLTPVLPPQAAREFHLEFEVVDTAEAFGRLEEEVEALAGGSHASA